MLKTTNNNQNDKAISQKPDIANLLQLPGECAKLIFSHLIPKPTNDLADKLHDNKEEGLIAIKASWTDFINHYLVSYKQAEILETILRAHFIATFNTNYINDQELNQVDFELLFETYRRLEINILYPLARCNLIKFGKLDNLSSACPEQETLTIVNQSTSYEDYLAKYNEIEASRFENYKKIPLMRYAQYYNLMRGQLTSAECEKEYTKIVTMPPEQYITAYQKKEPLLEDNYNKIVNQVKNISTVVNFLYDETAVDLTKLIKKLLHNFSGKNLSSFLTKALERNDFHMAQLIIDTGTALTLPHFYNYIENIKSSSLENKIITYWHAIDFFIKNQIFTNEAVLSDSFLQARGKDTPYLSIYQLYNWFLEDTLLDFIKNKISYQNSYVFLAALMTHTDVSAEIKSFLEPYLPALLVATNQLDALKKLFNNAAYLKKKPFLIEETDPNYETLFSLACHFEHLEIAQFLLDKGAREQINRKHKRERYDNFIHTKISDEKSLLYFMVKDKKSKAICFLLENNITIVKDEPLIYESVKQNDYVTTGLLLNAGVDPNVTYHGTPPVFNCYNTKLLQLLIKHNVNLDAKGTRNYHLLHHILSLYFHNRQSPVNLTLLIELLTIIFNHRGNLNIQDSMKPSLLTTIAFKYDSHQPEDMVILVALMNCHLSFLDDKNKYHIMPITTLLGIMLGNIISLPDGRMYLTYNDSLFLAYLIHVEPRIIAVNFSEFITDPMKLQMIKKHIDIYQKKTWNDDHYAEQIADRLPNIRIEYYMNNLQWQDAIDFIQQLHDDVPCKEVYTITCQLLGHEQNLDPDKLIDNIRNTIKSDFYKIIVPSFYLSILLLACIAKKQYKFAQTVIDQFATPNTVNTPYCHKILNEFLLPEVDKNSDGIYKNNFFGPLFRITSTTVVAENVVAHNHPSKELKK
ncbi:MAG: hypothetical protein ACK4PR_02185 [Gammaproteobacteria bacterium]